MRREKMGLMALISFLLLSQCFSVTADTWDDLDFADNSDKTTMIDPALLVEELSVDNLENNQYLERVPEMEDELNSMVFQCADGSMVLYYFQYPVKYVSQDGDIKDINTDISICADQDKRKEAFSYSSDQNSFQVFFADTIETENSAVVARKDTYEVGLTVYSDKKETIAEAEPVKSEEIQIVDDASLLSNWNANQKIDDDWNEIHYEAAYGVGTELIYSTTYTGYKEILKINSYTGKNKFSFVLDTNGLIPIIKEDGGVGLYEESTQEEIASIANIFVYDSADEPNISLNNYYIIENLQDSRYKLTAVIDHDFIVSENTVYPIMIDPTFSYKTASSIEEATVYSGTPNAASGSNYYNHVGYADSTNKVGYLLVKFPGLKNSMLFSGLTTSQIESVTYHVAKVGGSTANMAKLGAYYYTGSLWSQGTVTYNTAAVSSHTATEVAHVSMQSNKFYSFDITSAVKVWKTNNVPYLSYDRGIVIKNLTNNTSISYDRVLASTEYGNSVNSSYMPYVTVVFNNSGSFGGYPAVSPVVTEFAQNIYASSSYVRIEYSAIIYELNNLYYYYKVTPGTPHSSTVSKTVPSGATYVGYIHTHPNSESFSPPDINVANDLGGSAYVVTPSHSVKCYTSSTGKESTVATNITVYALTSEEKAQLVEAFQPMWEEHINSGCDFNCSQFTWPNE